MEYKIIKKITIGGSNRIYYRCNKGNETYILVWDKNIQYHLKIQKHLFDKGISVPEVHWSDENLKLILMEDLGDNSLYELSKKKRSLISQYRSAIKELVKFQVDGYDDAPTEDYYNYEHVKWEQQYFKKHFLAQYCKISRRKIEKLNDDFEKLAQELIKAVEPWSNFLMHRDYQSQNIYIKKRKAKIIDYQSARIGPLTYDLAALLRDSYVNITPKIEKKLIDYYLECLNKKHIKFKKRKFLYAYELTALQRNLQALGAFANLSLNKEKVRFKEYIPRGLELLRAGLEKTEYKELNDCVMSAQVSEACLSNN
jgi:aminoglycoside/choline kinase family phosphotransferase